MLLRDFLDFHSARGAGHEHRRADRAIHQDAQIKLALDVEAFFDQQAPDDAALFAGLRRHELHAQNAAPRATRPRPTDRASFTPPRLAAPACVNLRLHHHDGRAQPLRRGARFVLLEHHFAARHRNAELRENRFRLILVNLHDTSISARI